MDNWFTFVVLLYTSYFSCQYFCLHL